MKLLKMLTQCHGTSGAEGRICEIIKNEVSPYCDDITVDALGNLIAHKKGNGKKVMLAAHMDEIGIVVTFIEETGFLRFASVGGLSSHDLIGRRVCFENGTVGVIAGEKDNEKCAISKMYIDVGASDFKEAEKIVSVGDNANFMGEFITQGNRVISKALDNRVGCYVLIEAIKKIKSDNDLYFCFTSQEEVGLRGARTCAYSVNPEYALSIDVTDTGDTPECAKMAVKLGCGTAIKVMDYSVITSREVRGKLAELAKENGIKYQLEIMTEGGTDAGVIHFSRSGVKIGGLSIPTRYIHSPSEMADTRDIEETIKLLILFAENI